MIDKTIKNIKKILYKVLEGVTYSKNINNKKILYRVFRGDTYSKNSKYKIFLIFVFPIYKRSCI